MIELYKSNWTLYFAARTEAKRRRNYPSIPALDKLLFNLVWADVFINMATGGDPRETISSSLHKDRKSSWGAGFLINIIEAVDSDHGEREHQPDVGEGSSRNRELPGMERITIIIGWLLIITAVIFVIWRVT